MTKLRRAKSKIGSREDAKESGNDVAPAESWQERPKFQLGHHRDSEVPPQNCAFSIHVSVLVYDVHVSCNFAQVLSAQYSTFSRSDGFCDRLLYHQCNEDSPEKDEALNGVLQLLRFLSSLGRLCDENHPSRLPRFVSCNSMYIPFDAPCSFSMMHKCFKHFRRSSNVHELDHLAHIAGDGRPRETQKTQSTSSMSGVPDTEKSLQ